MVGTAFVGRLMLMGEMAERARALAVLCCWSGHTHTHMIIGGCGLKSLDELLLLVVRGLVR